MPPHAGAASDAPTSVFGVPLTAVAAFAIFLSVATRNSAAAIVGAIVYALTQEAPPVHEVCASWRRQRQPCTPTSAASGESQPLLLTRRSDFGVASGARTLALSEARRILAWR
jgi:type IV secretory pathway VirB3-like protein